MADRRRGNVGRRRMAIAGTAAWGFTLVEMLVALMILTLGITSLLASLSDSVALRRSADARSAVAAAVEEFVHTVAETGVRRRADAASDLDLELSLPGPTPVANFSGLTLRGSLLEAKDRIDVWLLRVEATWIDHGEPMVEEFLRVLPRQLPLRARVRRFQGLADEPPVVDGTQPPAQQVPRAADAPHHGNNK